MLSSSKQHPRLGQWDGRRHSSRHGTPILVRLAQPHVLLRLLPVLVTVILATLLVYVAGPPMTYRYGEVCDRDVRSRVYFEVVDEAQTGLDAGALADRLAAGGVETRPFFLGMHEQPVFRDRGLFDGERYPVAERLARQGLYLPSGLGLDECQLEAVCQAVRDALA